MSAYDLAGAYAGVRPLISSGDSRLLGRHLAARAELFETSSGMITITGGKLTTWRRMAKLAVDRLVARDGRQAPCLTEEIPLGAPTDPEHLPRVSGRRRGGPTHRPPARYGFAARQVLELAAAEPGAGAADRPRATRSAGRGPVRGVGRAGFVGRRRAVAADAAGPVGGARVLLRRGRRWPGGWLRRRLASLGWDAATVAAEAASFADEARAEGIVVAA